VRKKQLLSFLLAPDGPGLPVPVKRTISATDISFEIEVPTGRVLTPSDRKQKALEPEFTLTDIEEDIETKQTPTTNQRFLVEKTVYNPVLGRTVVKTAKILEQNQKKGETVYYTNGFESLDDFISAINKGS
jgi:hypothetical protein